MATEAIVAVVDREYILTRAGRDKILCEAAECQFDLDEVKQGDTVAIGDLYEAPKGLRGLSVSLVARADEGRVFSGEVMSVKFERCYCFVRADEGDDIFVHMADFSDYRQRESAEFNGLARGDRLCGVARLTTKGRRGSQVRLERAR